MTGKPTRVPRLIPETDEERARYARAEAPPPEPAHGREPAGRHGGAERRRRQGRRPHRRRSGRWRRRGLTPARFVGDLDGGGDRGGARERDPRPDELLDRLDRGRRRRDRRAIRWRWSAGSSPGRCSGRRPSAARIEALVPARRFADLAVPLTVTRDRSRQRGAAALRRRRRRTRRCWTCWPPPARFLSTTRRCCSTAGAAATAGSAACSRSRRPRGWPSEPSWRWTSGRGSRAAGARPRRAGRPWCGRTTRRWEP